ncbi:Light-independent protochlorophyllide reductase subunit N [Bienertia sinuspersici]
MWTGGGADNQGNFLGRISIRRNQVASMGGEVEDLELFQRKISDLFSDIVPPSCNKKDNHHGSLLPPSISLSTASVDSPIGSENEGEFTPLAGNDALLSIAWIRRLVDAFLCCESEFKTVLLIGRDPSQLMKSPLDRLIPDLLDRFVKALDICNAINHGIEAIKFMQIQAQIVVSALEQRPFTDGQIRRGRRALASLLGSIVVDEKETPGNRRNDHGHSGSARVAHHLKTGTTRQASSLYLGAWRDTGQLPNKCKQSPPISTRHVAGSRRA